MIYLLLTLLLFGLLQSLLELKKDSPNKTKWRIERILSLVYILGFIIGLIAIILQDNESSKINKLISDISASVTKIDSNSIEQVHKLSQTIQETESLVLITDSMNRSMSSMNKSVGEVLKIRDTLLVQTKKINEKLYQQLDTERQLLKEKEANVALMDYDIKWTKIDSTSLSVEACLRNFGKRNAIVGSGKGYVVFFDKQKNPLFNLDFPGNSIKSMLQPNEIQHAKLCYYTHGVYDFPTLKLKTDFAIVCVKITYEDALSETKKTEYFYSVWIPSIGFGGPKDWQLELGKKWEIKNHKFD